MTILYLVPTGYNLAKRGLERMATRKKPGAPIGAVRNPKGKNQYVEEVGQGKTEVLRLRISSDLKEKLAELAQTQDTTLTELVLDALKKAYTVTA